jgi:hypothetical protein
MKAQGKKAASQAISFVLAAITVSALVVSLYYYGCGLRHSPVFNPSAQAQKNYLQKFIENNDQNLKQEKLLAEGYWLRYKDVRKDRYWGENGPMGIWGPRDHYQLHGRREGRIFQPVEYPEDLTLEKELAEIYWNRYPEIEKNSIWGRNSQLGIVGPRDYHTHIGRFQQKVWGRKTNGDD